MDNGEVIPGMDEGWTFAGARVMEWGSGFVLAIMVQELFFSTPAKTMPLFLAILVGTTFGLAGLRKVFPDEERGVANYFMVQLGICPPGIPAPADIQPLWSGLPMQALDAKKEFVQLGLLEVFPHGADEEDGEDSSSYHEHLAH
ncbi:MAG: hypothetical protein KDD70_02480 [Bdellovibrionales bacterium]|nr:hypothetical protein [Bdellovibrionales bacterium]